MKKYFFVLAFGCNTVVSNAQHVGIGTATPGSGLELKGTGLGSQQRITDPVSGNSLVLQGGAGGNMKVTGYNYGTGTAQPLYLSVDGASTIINPNGGNVGIGVTTPSAKLHIAGNIKLNGIETIEFGGNWPGGKELNAGKIGYQTFSVGALDIVGAGTQISNRTIRFWNEGGAIFGGNVGIQTYSIAGYALAVNGNIRTKEVVVESGWADYVFEKNYSLMPLKEIEIFIQQHKHLPNIPSAKEVEQNGLHLGDMQKKMMEKIEELTLYILEMKKEIDLLKNNKTAL